MFTKIAQFAVPAGLPGMYKMVYVLFNSHRVSLKTVFPRMFGFEPAVAAADFT